MKNITIFKNYAHTTEPYYVSISTIINRIKSGNDKDIINKIRNEPDKTKRNKLKKGLPAILFAGKFKTRADSAIMEHSGKIILDFDGFKDSNEVTLWRETILKSYKKRFILALFLSPSGLGIKILVSIPPIKENHKKYFDALKNYFSDAHWDNSGSNLSRICYSSYDSNIYFNPEAEQWCEMAENKPYILAPLPDNILTSELEIVRILEKWFEKKCRLVKGENVNFSLYKLAISFNEYGVSKQFTESYILNKFGNSDNEKEIMKIIASAYKKLLTRKYFENKKGKNIIIFTGNELLGNKGYVKYSDVSDKDFRKFANEKYPEWKYFTVYEKESRMKEAVIKR